MNNIMIGDKVKIKKLPLGAYGGVEYTKDMQEYAKKNDIHTVEIVNNSILPGCTIIFISGVNLLFFSNEMLEKVTNNYIK